jgi:hypothetical protein
VLTVERYLDCCPQNLDMWLQMRLESVALGVRMGSVAVRECWSELLLIVAHQVSTPLTPCAARL